MKCFYHQNKNAVATCQNCGKGLCKECAEKNIPCLCEDCKLIISKSTEDEKKKRREDALIDTTSEFIVAIVKGLIALLISYLIINKAMGIEFSKEYYSLFFLPFGWALFTYLEQYLPPIFLGGVLFWIYLVVKLSASIILGIPCFIFQVIKFIIGIIKNRK